MSFNAVHESCSPPSRDCTHPGTADIQRACMRLCVAEVRGVHLLIDAVSCTIDSQQCAECVPSKRAIE